MTTSWPYRDLHVRLVPMSVISKLVRLGGVQDIKTGDKRFDRTFFVQSNDDEDVRRLLVKNVRAAVCNVVRKNAGRRGAHSSRSTTR